MNASLHIYSGLCGLLFSRCRGGRARSFPEEAAGASCLKQCSEGYYIQAQDEGSNIAMAYPVQKVCAWSKAHDVDSIDAEECPDVRLVCAKPFGVFPNACSGTAHLAKPWFVSFYSFSKETAPGTFETSLQTRVLVDRDTTCAGTYQSLSCNPGSKSTPGFPKHTCICTHICIYVYIYICMYIYIYVCLCVRCVFRHVPTCSWCGTLNPKPPKP